MLQIMDLKRLKFPKEVDPDFNRHLREKVNRYFTDNQISRFGNAGMVFKTVFMLSLYFVPYQAMMTGLVQNIWWMLFCWTMMGFGVAGVLGAKLAAPDRPCVSVSGDGAFLMHASVLATAVEY